MVPDGRYQHASSRTTTAQSSCTRFPFDPPVSPKAHGETTRADPAAYARTHETMFSFDESPNPVRRPAPRMLEQTPVHSPSNAADTGPGPPPPTVEYSPAKPSTGESSSSASTSNTSTPKRLMNTFKTRKERLVQQAGSAVAAATAAVTSSSGKQFKNPNYDPDLTMFPFDREAIDYERIQRECFAVEEELLFEHDRAREDELARGGVGGGGESPSKALFETEIFSEHYSIFQQYAYLSQQERDALEAGRGSSSSSSNRRSSRKPTPAADAFSPRRHRPEPPPIPPAGPRLSKFDQIATKFDMMPAKLGGGIGGGCGTLPDLRVDYFVETSCCSGAGMSVSPGGELEPPASVEPTSRARASSSAGTGAPSGGGGGVGLQRSMEATGTGAMASGTINVTSNPMEGAVCTQPRATIVVQQVRSFVRPHLYTHAHKAIYY